MAHKNDYSCIIFEDTKLLGKSTFVHNLYKYSIWLTRSKNYSNWTYINVYDRRNGNFIKRFYRTDRFIPVFL